MRIEIKLTDNDGRWAKVDSKTGQILTQEGFNWSDIDKAELRKIFEYLEDF